MFMLTFSLCLPFSYQKQKNVLYHVNMFNAQISIKDESHIYKSTFFLKSENIFSFYFLANYLLKIYLL